jgi:hypothetical protein
LEVLVHPGAASPFAARIWTRAIVVIPAYLVPSGRWREALRHELVHHRRGDPYWALAWDVLTALLWANPVVWGWRRRLAELQEMACDEELLEHRWVNPAAYGKTLLDVAEAISSNCGPRLAACAPMMEGRSTLSRRLDRILNHTRLRRSDMKGWIAWTLAGVILWAAMAAAWAGVRDEGKAEPALPQVQLKADLQQLTSEKVGAHLERCGACCGAAVVMDPATGTVLARAGFRRDKTTQKMVVDEAAPFNLCFMGASTMKPLVVAGALEDGAVKDSDLFDTSKGPLVIDGKTYREWKDGGLGKLTAADVLVKSSNLGAIQVAQRLGSERLAGFLERCGYHVAPDAPVADLSCGNYAGLSVSAYQMAYAYSILVNGGHDPRTGAAVVRPDVSHFIRQALVRTVEEGTGTEAQCKGLVVGGKTGTSIRESRMTSAVRSTGTGMQRHSSLRSWKGACPC